ncbi:MAG: PAS domain-containing protein [Balneolales bacterium]|nr:PAS domain-containing protein [Balneolales bacterium]
MNQLRIFSDISGHICAVKSTERNALFDGIKGKFIWDIVGNSNGMHSIKRDIALHRSIFETGGSDSFAYNTIVEIDDNTKFNADGKAELLEFSWPFQEADNPDNTKNLRLRIDTLTLSVNDDRGISSDSVKDLLFSKGLNKIIGRASSTENEHIAYWEVDLVTNKIIWSDRMYSMLGLDPEKDNITAETMFMSIHPEDRERAQQVFDLTLAGKTQYSISKRLIRKDGTSFNVKSIGFLDKSSNGENIRLYGILEDLSAQEKLLGKDAELISTAELSLIFERSLDLICTIDEDGRLKTVSEASFGILGYRPYELSGRFYMDFVVPEDHELTRHAASEIMGGKAYTNFENRYITKSGKIIFLHWSAYWDDSTRLMYCVARDVTENIRLKQLVSRSAAMVKLGAWEYQPQNNEILWSDQAKSIIGVAEEENPTLSDFLSCIFEESCRKEFEQKLHKACKFGDDFEIELSLRSIDNKFKWVKLAGNPQIANGQCQQVSGTLLDLSSKKILLDSISYKNNLLEELSNIMSGFLELSDPDVAVSQSLEIAGRAINADRAYYFKVHNSGVDGDHIKYLSQFFEWARLPEFVEAENQILQNLESSVMGDYFEDLEFGTIIKLKNEEVNAEHPFKEILDNQRIQSMVLIPLINNGEIEGIIGFDDCTINRDWTTDETSFLYTICTNLVSVLDKMHYTDTIFQANKEKEQILESIGDGFITVDKNWIVTYWNRSAEITLHEYRENMLGRNLWDIFPEAVGTTFYSSYVEAFKTNNAVHFEEKYDALGLWLEVSAYPSGSQLAIYFRDITERKKIQLALMQSNERFEKVSEATNDAIWDWDIQANIFYRGAGYHKIFGYSNLEDKNRKGWNNFIHPEDLKKVEESVHEALNNSSVEKWQLDYRCFKKDGSVVYITDCGIIIRDSNKNAIRMVGAMRDVTQRREYENSLKSLNEQLEKQAQQLSISNSELERFAYITSHDLQEPLRMISSFLTRLETKYAHELDDTAKKYISFAVDGAFRMRQMILDLLEFSRVGKSQLDIKSVDLNGIVSDVIQQYKKSIEEKGAIIYSEKLPEIEYYPVPAMQIFANIISNAIKYVETGKSPEIHINAEETEENWVISIKDNGIGIPQEYTDKIFTLFNRLHDKSVYDGTGIGLAIVKKNLMSYGGSVRLESVSGEGSTFFVSFPKKISTVL